jgi:hypothetical protein
MVTREKGRKHYTVNQVLWSFTHSVTYVHPMYRARRAKALFGGRFGAVGKDRHPLQNPFS